MTKRKSLIITLVVAFALSLLMAVTMLMPKNVALADGEDFAVKGASLRYTTTVQENGEDDDGTGLRFVLNAKQAYIDAADEIGMLLIPADMLEQGEELTVETESAIKNYKQAGDWTVDGDYMTSYFYLWNIPTDDCDREVVARGYAKVDGQYVYTTAVERSFESVAIAAIAGSENTQEDKDMCAALSKYVVTDPGNVAYIGSENSANVSLMYGAWANLTQNFEYNGEKTHAVSWNSTSWLQIHFDKLAVKDFSDYDYFYTDLYIEGSGTYTVNFGILWANEIEVPANQWTRIVFAKDGNGVFKTANGKTLLNDGTSSSFVDKISISVGDSASTDATNVYFRQMRLANEVPTLDVTLGNVAEGDTITMANTYTVNNAENATVNVKVSVDGAAATAITDATYTFEKKGTYTFIYDLIVDGKTVTYTKTVNASVRLYTIVDFTDPDAIASYDLEGGWGSTIYPTNTVVSPAGGVGTLQASVSTYGGILINAPAITDLSGYNFVFVDVLNYWGEGSFSFSHLGDRVPQINIAGNQTWTRVVAVNDGNGNFYISGYESLGTIHTNSASVTSYSMFFGGATNYFFGMFAACNELPELPAGMTTNYTASTEPEGPEESDTNAIVDFTAANTISTYGLVGAWTETMSVTPDADATRYPVNNGKPIRVNAVSMGGVSINSPAITAISQYNYLYIDIMIAYGDAEFVVSYVWGAPKIQIAGNNTWTRIVLVNDGNGNFTIPNATGSITEGYDGSAVALSGNVTSYTMAVLAADNWAYFGMFAACDELPELPQGFATNYTPVA